MPGQRSFDNTLRVWNLKTGKCIATLEGHSKYLHSVQIIPGGQFAVSGSGDNTVKIWDLDALCCVGTLEGHQSDVHSVAVSPDGTLIASTGFRILRFNSGISNRVCACKL